MRVRALKLSWQRLFISHVDNNLLRLLRSLPYLVTKGNRLLFGHIQYFDLAQSKLEVTNCYFIYCYICKKRTPGYFIFEAFQKRKQRM